MLNKTYEYCQTKYRNGASNLQSCSFLSTKIMRKVNVGEKVYWDYKSPYDCRAMLNRKGHYALQKSLQLVVLYIGVRGM